MWERLLLFMDNVFLFLWTIVASLLSSLNVTACVESVTRHLFSYSRQLSSSLGAERILRFLLWTQSLMFFLLSVSCVLNVLFFAASASAEREYELLQVLMFTYITAELKKKKKKEKKNAAQESTSVSFWVCVLTAQSSDLPVRWDHCLM